MPSKISFLGMLGTVFVKRIFESDLPSAVWADNSLRRSLAQKDVRKAHSVCLKGLCSFKPPHTSVILVLTLYSLD